jgi:hypothetical protein
LHDAVGKGSKSNAEWSEIVSELPNRPVIILWVAFMYTPTRSSEADPVPGKQALIEEDFHDPSAYRNPPVPPLAFCFQVNRTQLETPEQLDGMVVLPSVPG